MPDATIAAPRDAVSAVLRIYTSSPVISAITLHQISLFAPPPKTYN